MTSMSPRRSSTRSASFVVGPFAPSASSRHLSFGAFSLVITRSRAAGMSTVHSVSRSCSFEMASPPPKSFRIRSLCR